MEHKLFSTIPLNEDQIALAKWISSGLNINEVRDLKGDASYLLNNMIAKFISASPTYHLSKKLLFLCRQIKLTCKRDIREVDFMENRNPLLMYMNIPYPALWYAGS